MHLSVAVYLNTAAIVPSALVLDLGLLAVDWILTDAPRTPAVRTTVQAANNLIFLIQDEHAIPARMWEKRGGGQARGGPALSGLTLTSQDVARLKTIGARYNVKQGMSPCHARLDAHVTLRGSGLVGSAFGMLCHRNAVEAFVARWCGGRWVGRLDGPRHLIFSLDLCSRQCQAEGTCEPPPPSLDIVRRALGVPSGDPFAHAPTMAITGDDDAQREGLRKMNAELPELPPMQPGGKRFIWVTRVDNAELGTAYDLLTEMQQQLAGASAQRGAAHAKYDGALALLSGAGGMLAATGRAFQADLRGMVTATLASMNRGTMVQSNTTRA